MDNCVSEGNEEKNHRADQQFQPATKDKFMNHSIYDCYLLTLI